MKKHVDYYKLERISSRMAKEFGTIPKGDEIEKIAESGIDYNEL